MKKVIITGVTGAIGHALIDECLAQGAEVFAICRPGSPRNTSLPQHNNLHIILAAVAQRLNCCLRIVIPFIT